MAPMFMASMFLADIEVDPIRVLKFRGKQNKNVRKTKIRAARYMIYPPSAIQKSVKY
jgi:hypothetical protein